MKKWHYITLSTVLIFGGMLLSAFIADKSLIGACICLLLMIGGGLVVALLGEKRYPTVHHIYVVKDNEGVMYGAYHSEERAKAHRDHVQAIFERNKSRKIARVIQQELK